MIIGTGCDIVNITRIREAYHKFNGKFLTRVFTSNEILVFQSLQNQNSKYCYLAKRFAAKEAYAKALGTGMGKNIWFTDIEVYNDETGKPNFSLKNKEKQFINHKKTIESILIKKNKKLSCQSRWVDNIQVHLSISDDYNVAMAYVIISYDFLSL